MSRGVKIIVALGVAAALCLGLGIAGLHAGILIATTNAQQQVPGINLEPCQLSSPDLPIRIPAECGTLTVFEDRESGTGRQIDLNVAVVKAVRGKPEPDPLFFLTGGPGQAATESYTSLFSAFDRIREKRDIVLVDQRGTGRSNPLQCPQVQELEGSSSLDESAFELALNGCLEQLEADPRLYTTPIAMDDLDQVRHTLGYEKINLYGVSYGTRAALTYLRQYPERVRTVILDGVWPLGLTLSPNAASSAQRALDLMFDRCAADAACNAAFPDLRSEFADLLYDLERQPAKVSLDHPITAEPLELTFTREQLASGVRLLTYSPETVALLPLLIHTAHVTGDYRLLAAQTLMVGEQLADSISLGMGYTVVCAEDYPFFTEEEAASAGANSYLGSIVADTVISACSTWPKGVVPEGFNELVESDVPVLLLSGEADPVTPPTNAEFAARTLPNSLHLVAPGQGHNVIFRGCIPKIAAAFVESGTTEGLDVGCVQEIVPMPFFVSPVGPQP